MARFASPPATRGAPATARACTDLVCTHQGLHYPGFEKPVGATFSSERRRADRTVFTDYGRSQNITLDLCGNTCYLNARFGVAAFCETPFRSLVRFASRKTHQDSIRTTP